MVQSGSRPIRIEIELGDSVQVRSDAASTLVRSKKARALIAMTALSVSGSVSRQVVTATLWSSVERAIGLARLRDVIHNTLKDFRLAGIEVLELEGDEVRLRPGTVRVKLSPTMLQPGSGVDRWARFLAELEQIDPAMDRWLTLARQKQRQLENPIANKHDPASHFVPKEERPSIVITEFEGIGPHAALARMLTGEMAARLAKLRWLTTITRNDRGQRLKAGKNNLARIANYALIGTVNTSDTGCQLLLELVSLRRTGGTCWASSFEPDLRHGAMGWQQLADVVSARLDAELLMVEVERRNRSKSSEPDTAYSMVLQAIPGIYKLERAYFLRAGHLLQHAVIVEPESAFAHSWLAYWNVFLVGQGWAGNPFQSMSQAAWASERAMLLDPKDSRAVTIAGHVKAFLHRRLDEASALHELALELNSAMPLVWHLAGMTHAYAGRLQQAHTCINHCLMLAPADPFGFFVEGALAIVYLLQHKHGEALQLSRRVTERHPGFTSALKSYLAVLGHLGHRTEATRVLRRLLELEPHFSLKRFYKAAPYQRREDLEHFTSGLRLAGVL